MIAWGFSLYLSMKISQYIHQIEAFVPQYEVLNTSVSKASVGWHLDHSLKVINGVIELLKSAPTDKKAKLTMLGRFCLLAHYIPRGKGKAPKTVLPPETITSSDLAQQIEISKQLVYDLEFISEKATFKHPYFGILSKTQTLKFIRIHTKHHLKIVRDILD